MDMEIKRIDHLGIISGVIKDLGLIEMLDERLQKDNNGQEHVSPGEAIAAMIMNGLGFSDRPLTLTPQFFETKALDVLFREGVKAEHFNRHKLGKILDSAFEYGCENLFYEVSTLSCAKEGIDMKFNSEDTTTFSLTGNYAEDVDEHSVKISYGYSKDHRQDLKQVVQEMLVSQDGGVPLMMKSWNGNASDNEIFTERANLLIENFKQSEGQRYLIADSKLYSKTNSKNLNQLLYITRVPGTIKEERESITEAIKNDKWEAIDENNRYYEKGITHYDIKQRWLVVYSSQARKRSEKTLKKACNKEFENFNKKLRQLSTQGYDCAQDAEKIMLKLIRRCRYHKLSSKKIITKNIYAKKGRPKADSPPKSVQYFIHAEIETDKDVIEKKLNEKSCYVLATNIESIELDNNEIIVAYKNQNKSIENMGFRFLKDPIFFASSLFLKKPSRIMGLLMVMTLALLVYSIAQRRMRNFLQETNDTIPNQINKPTQTPTLRWVFQLLDGIHVVKVTIEGIKKTVINGINEIKRKILGLFGSSVKKLYCLEGNVIF